MLVWKPEDNQSKHRLELARAVALNPVLVRTGLPWFPLLGAEPKKDAEASIPKIAGQKNHSIEWLFL